MKRKLIKVFIGLFVFIFCAKGVFADEISPINMGFYAAIKYALENNNSIKAMKKELSASERDIGIERSDMMPKLVFNESFMVTNNPIEAFAIKLNQTRATAGDLWFGTLDFPGATTNFLTSGVIEQKIFDKKSMIEIKMAKKEYSANGYVYLRKQEEIVNKVAQAYLNVIISQMFVEMEEKNHKETVAHLKIIEAKYKSKTGLFSDVLKAKAAVEKSLENAVSLKRNVDVARRNLGLALGIDCPIYISSPMPNMCLQCIDFYKRFSVYRNDIKAAEIRVENAKNNIKTAQADWYPTMSAMTSYNLYNSNYPFGAQGSNYITGVFFRWVLFDGNKRVYQVLKARDKEAEAREYLAGFRKDVDFKIYEGYASVEENLKKLELATNANKHAEADLIMVEKHWQDPQMSFLAVLDAQNNVEATRMNVLNYQKALLTAIINLSYESGIICQELALK